MIKKVARADRGRTVDEGTALIVGPVRKRGIGKEELKLRFVEAEIGRIRDWRPISRGRECRVACGRGCVSCADFAPGDAERKRIRAVIGADEVLDEDILAVIGGIDNKVLLLNLDLAGFEKSIRFIVKSGFMQRLKAFNRAGGVRTHSDLA